MVTFEIKITLQELIQQPKIHMLMNQRLAYVFGPQGSTLYDSLYLSASDLPTGRFGRQLPSKIIPKEIL
jgi:hypothetical protein